MNLWHFWHLWFACGFVGWMGAETLNANEDGDLLNLRLHDRTPTADFAILLTGIFFGPLLLAIVVKRLWVNK